VDGLQAPFGEYVHQLRTIRFWIAEVRLGGHDLHDEIRIGRPPLDNFDAQTLRMLEKSSFESAHSIAQTLSVAHSTVLLHLPGSMEARSFHLH
jgi:hypothetical protein